jgi:lipopolysaccharide assembly protein A
MQVIRTILWIAITAILVAFIAMNWTTAPVNIWPLADGNYLHFEWPVGVVALLFFLLGAVPVWLVHRAASWRLKRRIAALENSLHAVSSTPAPVATPTAAPLAPPAEPVSEPDLHSEQPAKDIP